MLIIISPEEDSKDEINKLHQLFEAGLTCYHLRKPYKNFVQYCDYLNRIDKKYYRKIVMHHFHELMNDYDLKGIHFSEKKRKYFFKRHAIYLGQLKTKDKTISSSFHELADIENCPFKFDYHFLSPVFTSISKNGYAGRRFDVNLIDKKVIGLGGVTQENLYECKRLGYHGVAVLGTIWTNETPADVFEIIKNEWEALSK